ncbi:MAG: hypothetical protein O3A00_17325, partial [Planctomycetota bacterium]|nr:hypothetical protein [Planctomycetota bacterium]
SVVDVRNVPTLREPLSGEVPLESVPPSIPPADERTEPDTAADGEKVDASKFDLGLRFDKPG